MFNHNHEALFRLLGKHYTFQANEGSGGTSKFGSLEKSHQLVSS